MAVRAETLDTALGSDDWGSVEFIRDHYDRLPPYYRVLWGEHLHHGYWEGAASPEEAQVKLIERLARRAEIPRGAHVLDVGCGVGGSALWLARHLGCSVHGITISPVQAEIATRAARSQGLSHRVCFEVKDANELDFPPEGFDAVWVVECSEHLGDKARFLRDCARVLRPDGTMALCAWLRGDTTTPERARLVREICRGMLCPSLASLEEYLDCLGECGFENVEGEDLREQVQETWSRCAALVRRPWVRQLVRTTDDRTRAFVGAFPTMRRAYAEAALGYGMFTARKGTDRNGVSTPESV